MEKRVLSWGAEGRRSATAGTVGPSLAEVWVVVMTGMEKTREKWRSFWVVRTLEGGGGGVVVSLGVAMWVGDAFLVLSDDQVGSGVDAKTRATEGEGKYILSNS